MYLKVQMQIDASVMHQRSESHISNESLKQTTSTDLYRQTQTRLQLLVRSPYLHKYLKNVSVNNATNPRHLWNLGRTPKTDIWQEHTDTWQTDRWMASERKREALWKGGKKNERQTFFVLSLFRPHRCALEPVQLAAWQIGKNSPIWAGR